MFIISAQIGFEMYNTVFSLSENGEYNSFFVFINNNNCICFISLEQEYTSNTYDREKYRFFKIFNFKKGKTESFTYQDIFAVKKLLFLFYIYVLKIA
jgi:hypothetical protein